jgi:hypothetical protein
MSVVRSVRRAVVLVTVAGVRAASAQDAPRLDIAGQVTFLRLSDPGSTATGIGGRITFDVSRWAAVDAEINVYPQDEFTIDSTTNAGTTGLTYERRRIDGFAGVKIGKRTQRFGVFAKVRPGFTRLTDKGVACAGEVCALVLIARPEYQTEFALDLGGVVEYYPTPRTLLRVDFGDTLIRHRSSAPPCSDCTTNNFAARVGVGVRF